MTGYQYTAPNDYRTFCDIVEYHNSLQHHGIKNQKWGVRRFQNDDGSLTPAGKERYKKEGLKKRDIQSVTKEKDLDKKTLANTERRFYKGAKIAVAGLGASFVAKRLFAKAAANTLTGEGSAAGIGARVGAGTLLATAATGAGIAATVLGAKGALTQRNISKRRQEIRNPNGSLNRKDIKNASASQLNAKERANAGKWLKAGALAGGAAGATALGVKKYGGLSTVAGKRALAGGAALSLASLATMERAAINDSRIERRRRKLDKEKKNKR